jgi:hypothetical protein
MDVGRSCFCGFCVDGVVRGYAETGALAYLYNYLIISSPAGFRENAVYVRLAFSMYID